MEAAEGTIRVFKKSEGNVYSNALVIRRTVLRITAACYGLKLTGTDGDGHGSYGYGAWTGLKATGCAGIGFDICPRAVLYHRLSRLAKVTPSEFWILASVPLVWSKTVSCRLCAG